MSIASLSLVKHSSKMYPKVCFISSPVVCALKLLSTVFVLGAQQPCCLQVTEAERQKLFYVPLYITYYFPLIQRTLTLTSTVFTCSSDNAYNVYLHMQVCRLTCCYHAYFCYLKGFWIYPYWVKGVWCMDKDVVLWQGHFIAQSELKTWKNTQFHFNPTVPAAEGAVAERWGDMPYLPIFLGSP